MTRFTVRLEVPVILTNTYDIDALSVEDARRKVIEHFEEAGIPFELPDQIYESITKEAWEIRADLAEDLEVTATVIAP